MSLKYFFVEHNKARKLAFGFFLISIPMNKRHNTLLTLLDAQLVNNYYSIMAVAPITLKSTHTPVSVIQNWALDPVPIKQANARFWNVLLTLLGSSRQTEGRAQGPEGVRPRVDLLNLEFILRKKKNKRTKKEKYTKKQVVVIANHGQS